MTKTVIDRQYEILPTPIELADCFCDLMSDDMAKFFNHVALCVEHWPHGFGSLAMQLQHVTDEPGLTDEARSVMSMIGEYASSMSKDTKWALIETAPKDGTSIILWAQYSKPMQADWNEELKQWECGKLIWSEGDCGPTHWMPMPSPPEF